MNRPGVEVPLGGVFACFHLLENGRWLCELHDGGCIQARGWGRTWSEARWDLLRKTG